MFAIGIGSETTESEARIALAYANREASIHDLLVTFDGDEVCEIDRTSTARDLTSRFLVGRERPAILFDWTRDHCDIAEKVVMITSAPFISVYPTEFEKRFWSHEPVLEPFCASMLVLVPRKGRVPWSENEVCRIFLNDGKHSTTFQRVTIVDHDGVVNQSFENANPCMSYDQVTPKVKMHDDGSFELPDPSDFVYTPTRKQITLEEAR